MKENLEDKDWSLLARHLGKELSDEEKQQLDHWLEESEINRKELAYAEKIWDSSNIEDNNSFDTDKGWHTMKKRIHNGSDKKRLLNPQFIKIAASILILLSVGLFLYWITGPAQYVKITAENQKILSPVVLPDGTKVCLNIGATLKYPKTFKKDTRTVELTGEAFFDVTHDASHPFIIQTAKAKIKVLGTSFNVAAYQASDSVQVVVETGTVELSSKINNNPIRLTKGSTGVYYASNNKLLKSDKSDINTTSWKTNVIIFKNVDLLYVTKTLHKLFSESFHFENEKLKNCRVNSDFKDANIDSILKTIKIVNKVNIEKTNNGYIISGPGC
jgi:ferric-dicitrate binding protein FerR (iron transport regulator)